MADDNDHTMLQDARGVSNGETIETDVCIIGAGVAGITMACEFDATPLKVTLLESGGREFDSATQSLYKGDIVGKTYYSLDTSRLRFLGGTSNHWGGNCRELDDIDFDTKAWAPNTGWPLSKAELAPYYTKASRYCKLDTRGFSADDWKADNLAPLTLSEDVKTQVTQFAPATSGGTQFEPLKFGKTYVDALTTSQNIALFLYANVVDIVSNETNTHVEGVKVVCIKGNAFVVKARYVILATGGIENARLLLASTSRSGKGLGNENDLVGRFFMEHLSVEIGLLLPLDKDLSRLDMYEVPGRRVAPQGHVQTRTKGYLSFAPAVLERERILSVTASMSRLGLPPAYSSDAYKSLKTIVGDVRYGVMPRDLAWHLWNLALGLDDIAKSLHWRYTSQDELIDLYQVRLQCEQLPNADSRIALGAERDILGMRRAKLDWRLSDIDLRTVRRAAMELALEFGRGGVGRLMIELPESDRELSELIGGDWHHMGTTRMSRDPRQGVVDSECRVHGLDNLFVTGSSVFPSGGHSVPTFTIVALSVRLADYIKKQYRQSVT